MSAIDATRAAARLVSASPTAIRPDAGASSTATGVRSPMAKASPRRVLSPIAVTATSATGTCHGPTIWSRAVRPPTLRSPIVMRKDLSATVGRRITRYAASLSSMASISSATLCSASCWTSRVMRGGLPSSACIDISTAWLLNRLSLTISCSSPVAVPTTANGQRSRSHKAAKRSRSFGAMAST